MIPDWMQKVTLHNGITQCLGCVFGSQFAAKQKDPVGLDMVLEKCRRDDSALAVKVQGYKTSLGFAWQVDFFDFVVLLFVVFLWFFLEKCVVTYFKWLLFLAENSSSKHSFVKKTRNVFFIRTPIVPVNFSCLFGRVFLVRGRPKMTSASDIRCPGLFPLTCQPPAQHGPTVAVRISSSCNLGHWAE